MGNRKTRLDNYGGNMGLKKILFFGRQIGLQAVFLCLRPGFHLFPNICFELTVGHQTP